MKIRRIVESIEFAPITVTLENLREARVFVSALILGEWRMKVGGFIFTDCSIIRDIIDGLESEGIEEI